MYMIEIHGFSLSGFFVLMVLEIQTFSNENQAIENMCELWKIKQGTRCIPFSFDNFIPKKIYQGWN